MKRALIGLNAAVVGTLLAAFYNPIWIHSIYDAKDFALFVILYGLLAFWKLPPWMIVIIGAIGGILLGMI
jgi:chromate transporter